MFTLDDHPKVGFVLWWWKPKEGSFQMLHFAQTAISEIFNMPIFLHASRMRSVTSPRRLRRENTDHPGATPPFFSSDATSIFLSRSSFRGIHTSAHMLPIKYQKGVRLCVSGLWTIISGRDAHPSRQPVGTRWDHRFPVQHKRRSNNLGFSVNTACTGLRVPIPMSILPHHERNACTIMHVLPMPSVLPLPFDPNSNHLPSG